MQITDARENGTILTATDGRFAYTAPFAIIVGEGHATIDGRKVWRGFYCDPITGCATDERVDGADWIAMCALFSAVDRHNMALSERRTSEYWAKMDARDAALDGIENVRGGAYDPNADGAN